ILALFQQQGTRRQTAGTAEQYLDDAPFEFRSGGIAALAWNTDGQVVDTIGGEIACSQCGAEQVAFLRSLGDGGCVLVETPQCGSEHDRNAPGIAHPGEGLAEPANRKRRRGAKSTEYERAAPEFLELVAIEGAAFVEKVVLRT